MSGLESWKMALSVWKGSKWRAIRRGQRSGTEKPRISVKAIRTSVMHFDAPQQVMAGGGDRLGTGR